MEINCLQINVWYFKVVFNGYGDPTNARVWFVRKYDDSHAVLIECNYGKFGSMRTINTIVFANSDPQYCNSWFDVRKAKTPYLKGLFSKFSSISCQLIDLATHLLEAESNLDMETFDYD